MQLCDLQCSRLWCTILPRPTKREKAPISPTYPTMGENPRIQNLDRSSHLGEIFPRSQPPPSSEARPKMTISSPYRASTASYPASFIQHLARCSSLHTATALHCLSLSTSSSLCPSFMLKKESEGKRRRPTPKGRGAERRGERERESERSWSE